jgi:hypothetical protein
MSVKNGSQKFHGPENSAVADDEYSHIYRVDGHTQSKGRQTNTIIDDVEMHGARRKFKSRNIRNGRWLLTKKGTSFCVQPSIILSTLPSLLLSLSSLKILNPAVSFCRIHQNRWCHTIN